MDLIRENIYGICQEISESQGFILVDLIIRGDNRKRIIEVYVDGETSVSAENLSQLSRQINEIIESKNIIQETYRLDVSTPGVDRPLKYLKQYSKHINRNFEINYKSGEEIVSVKAKLIAIESEELTFLAGKSNLIIKYNDIIKAKVLISFS